MIRKLLGAMILCAVLLVQNLPVQAAAVEPRECPKDLKYLLGMYYGNGEQFVIRERGGELELLYRTTREDYKFARSNQFPLKKERFDSYTLLEAGPMNNTETSVRFERDPDGYGITCKIGGNRYSRAFFGADREKPFRLPQPEDWQALKNAAAEAVMPAALAEGKQARLVDVAKAVPGIKLDLRYAGTDNCFGVPIVDVQKAYLDQEAAAALSRVKKKLADYGYGLVIWEAYRPWSVSKLAYDAFPEDKKQMLPAPEQGFSHNTGRSVDVSLYYLETGEPAAMISDFDEPSVRQYTKFAGGTELERYQRDLLHQLMSLEGFSGSDVEWWHFDYEPDTVYSHLNLPLAELN